MNAKRFAKVAGAAALSFGLVGTFAMPAYASAPEAEGLPDGFMQPAPAQSLLTVDVEADVLPLAAPDVEVSEEVRAEQARKKAEEEAQRLLAEQQAAAELQRQQEEAAKATADKQQKTTTTTSKDDSDSSSTDTPAGVGAQGIVNAAKAQLGQFQDCTALVERSLRAVGIPAGDLGTQIFEYTALGGTLVTSGDYLPGDILIWSGRHVAVYIGNGQAVHGGFMGNQTVIASAFLDGAPNGVVRF